MSDLYLVLRHRLDDVADRQDWVYLGMETLRDARRRKGLSYETAARLIPTSSKTYERNEKRGRVARHQLARYAEVLDLEIEWPERERVRVAETAAASGGLEREIRHDLRDMGEGLDRIEGLLRELIDRLPGETRSA